MHQRQRWNFLAGKPVISSLFSDKGLKCESLHSLNGGPLEITSTRLIFHFLYFSRDSDLLIHEATYSNSGRNEAKLRVIIFLEGKIRKPPSSLIQQWFKRVQL